MPQRFLILFTWLLFSKAFAQSREGLTGIPDTGYTIHAEYKKNIKAFPFIGMALRQYPASVKLDSQIVYTTRNGKAIELDVFYPTIRSTAPHKTIVFIHGGGWRSGHRSLHHSLAEKLASIGYVCITPSYRLSTEALFPAAIQDIKTAIRWTKANAAKYHIDTNAIVVAGHSAGGQLAALTGATNGSSVFDTQDGFTKTSSNVNGVIDIDGILAFIHKESGEGDDSKRISAATYWFGYSKTQKPVLWHQASALTHAGPQMPPVLFMNSMVDRMHAGQTDLIQILDKHSIYSEVKPFKSAPHSFLLFHPWFDSTIDRMDVFMRRLFDRPATAPFVSEVWRADNGDGSYQNPVIHADYSDPDAIRVGDDFYLVASSFVNTPGLPILHSKDLVNWKIISHALPRNSPDQHFRKVQHGGGVWAPSIRYHKNEFYIYYPDPDFGIYMIKSKNVEGPWSTPVLVEAGKGIIDPCPFWDDNGKAYLAHAYAGSRAGIKSLLVIKEMNAEGTRTIHEGRIVFDGHAEDQTIEGPKVYKRNGYYYIFAPAGGVATGWQLVLRSKNIYGPYQRRVVMDQGKTTINGPHQGAWVDTRSGESWFLHFQDKEAYGRVVHLQPMKWVNDWPLIGSDNDGNGIGEPVLRFRKPAIAKPSVLETPADTDEFNGQTLGLQWQWNANAEVHWAYPYEGKLRMFAQPFAENESGLYDAPNLLLQKFPAETFTATARLQFYPKKEGERMGLMVFGEKLAYLSVEKITNGLELRYSLDKQPLATLTSNEIYFQVRVSQGGMCTFSYSTDGVVFVELPTAFKSVPGKWIGAKVGLFCISKLKNNDPGYVDVDWFRVTKNK